MIVLVLAAVKERAPPLVEEIVNRPVARDVIIRVQLDVQDAKDAKMPVHIHVALIVEVHAWMRILRQ